LDEKGAAVDRRVLSILGLAETMSAVCFDDQGLTIHFLNIMEILIGLLRQSQGL
jgi:hypothetical protein